MTDRTPTGDLRIVPVRFEDACGFVAMWHRHHAPPVGCKFCIGVAARPGWNMPSRPRNPNGAEGIPRTLWEAS